MQYRREVDGLRALAVLPVILFHAGFEVFSGGFVGVDVFFVISGYLITSIIVDELNKGEFSIVSFYERRAKRILPALYLVVLVCIPFAWHFLQPSDLKAFSKSVFAVTTFSSNILFWSESGYFEVATELKPLLHTWSLAVEEQYYMLFPVTLVLMWRLGQARIVSVLVILTVLSLTVAQYGAKQWPEAAYFLLPTRGWELLVGAIAAFYSINQSNNKPNKVICELLALIGIVLLGYSIFQFNKQTLFPGLSALVPVTGALLLILFTDSQTIVGKFIGNKAFVGIGLISYSAYLWHQPLLAFARQISTEEPSSIVLGSLVLLSFLLAYVSWKYIEKPFRKIEFNLGLQISIALLISIFLVIFGLFGYLSKGFEEYTKRSEDQKSRRVAEIYQDARLHSSVFEEKNRVDNGECIFSVENVNSRVESRLLSCYKKYGKGLMLIGDSHATNLFNSIYTNSGDRLKFFIGITKNSCHLPTVKKECQYDEFLKFIIRNPKIISGVIYEKAGWLMMRNESGNMSPALLQKYRLNESFGDINKDEETIDGVISYLTKVSLIAPVVWFGPRVEPQIHEKVVYKLGCDYKFFVRPEQYSAFKKLDDFLKTKVSEIHGIKYLSQIEAYKFDFSSDFMNCNNTYWIDGNHYSPYGEKKFGERFNFIEYLRDKSLIYEYGVNK